MFLGYMKLISLYLNNFNTYITDMRYMFSRCIHLISLDLSNFETSSVINIAFMFNESKQLTPLD